MKLFPLECMEYSDAFLTLQESDMNGWISGLCNGSSRSIWVEVVCNYTHSQVLPTFLWSNLSMAVIEAVVSAMDAWGILSGIGRQ